MNEADTVQTVADAAHTVPVAIKGFTWGAGAGWGTLVVLTVALATFIKAFGPAKLYEIWVVRDKSLRDGKREEVLSNKDEITKLKEQMVRTTGALVFLSNAVVTAVNALASEDHAARETAAALASELVAMAVSTLGAEDPFSKALAQLGKIHR